MTRDVVAVTEDTPLPEIAATLAKHHVKRVPVLRQGKLVGIVSRANLLQGFALESETQRQAARAAVESTAGVERFEDNLVVTTPALRAGRGYV